MVYISNAVVIATIATAPILAAPIRGGIKGPYGCQRGVKPSESLEARDPATNWKGIAKGVGTAITAASSVFGIASAIKDSKQAPPPPQGQPQAPGKREYDEDLEIDARDPAGSMGSIGNGVDGALDAGESIVSIINSIRNLKSHKNKREYDEDLEIDARDPAVPWGGLARGAGRIIGAASTTAGLVSALMPQKPNAQPQAQGKREYDEDLEIYTREPAVLRKTPPNGVFGLPNVGGTVGKRPLKSQPRTARPRPRELEGDLEELEARVLRVPSPETMKMIAKGVGGAAGIGGGIAVGLINRKQARELYDDLEDRDEDEGLEARDPLSHFLPSNFGGKIGKFIATARKISKHIRPREVSYDELD